MLVIALSQHYIDLRDDVIVKQWVKLPARKVGRSRVHQGTLTLLWHSGARFWYIIFQISRDLIPAAYENEKSSLTFHVCLLLYHV